VGILGLAQGNAYLVATGRFDFFAGLGPFLPGFGRWKTMLLVQVFAVGHAGWDVIPWYGHPAAFNLSRVPRQVVPPAQFFPEVFHEFERFEVFVVQTGLAKEQKDNIVSRAGLLLLGHFDVGIAVRDEIDLHMAFIGLFELLGPALQILIR